jgi:DNA-binding NarL/FixJ family response regulator
MTGNAPIKIAIIDDHPLLIKGLQSMFSHHPDILITGAYQDGTSLLEGLKEAQPDVLLLDIQMHGQMGDELAPVLRKLYPEIMILALTNLEHRYYIKSMLQHGARGYVLKSSDEEILITAIRAVAKGDTYFDPSIREQVVKAQKSNELFPSLTRREKEILRLIASNYSSQDIADNLCLSKRTVENHRTHLLQKLDVKNSASLIRIAMEFGLI